MLPLVRLVVGALIAICAMYVAFKFTASAFGIGWAGASIAAILPSGRRWARRRRLPPPTV